MRIQTKTFYADLFSKSPAPAAGAKPRSAPAADVKPRPAPSTKITAIKPMAPLAPALSSKAPPRPKTPDQAPGKAAEETTKETTQEIKKDSATEKALALPVPAPAAQKPSALTKLIGALDIHDISPRQMTHLSQTLYAAGALSFEDYSQLAFQPELHPDYERTIGALTGEHAAPDRRRDFVSLWNERADFQRRHNAGRPDLIAQSERIASVLSRIETPMNVMA